MKQIIAALALSAGIAVASAQHTPPTPAQMAQHEVERYTDRLSLTSDQQQQATTIFTAAAASVASLHEQQRAAHEALKAAITSGDTAAIPQQANTLGQIETEMTTAHATAEAKFYKLLTADQQAKFAQSLDRPWGRGPGGPGGPPPEE
jgi:Spy/CpxP family protein refolding chaperone